MVYSKARYVTRIKLIYVQSRPWYFQFYLSKKELVVFAETRFRLWSDNNYWIILLVYLLPAVPSVFHVRWIMWCTLGQMSFTWRSLTTYKWQKASISNHRIECAVIFYIIDRPTVIIGEKKKQSRLPVTQQRRSFLRFSYLTADSVASWQENSTRTRTRLLAPWIMEKYDCFGFMVLILVRYLTGIILMWESTKIITS